MYKEQSKFELYIELLTQVKHGNRSYSGLSECTRLSRDILDQTIAQLLHEGLLKSTGIGNEQDDQTSYRITDGGEQFIDFTGMTPTDVELRNYNKLTSNQ